MKVNNEIFYHISRLDKLNFDENQKVIIDDKNQNQSIIDVLNYHSMLDLREGKGEQGLINALYHDSDVLKRKVEDWPNFILDVVLKTTRRYAELVFESIRIEKYPDLPSRQTCIYLSKLDDVERWYPAISNNFTTNPTIIKVSATGVSHIADQRWLQDNDVLPHGHFVNNAQNYWQGNLLAGNNTAMEVLFTGELKKLSVFNSLQEFIETEQ